MNKMLVSTAALSLTVTQIALADLPGANGNATELAGMFEAARVLSQHQFAGSIVYAALSGEEQGLFGE